MVTFKHVSASQGRFIHSLLAKKVEKNDVATPASSDLLVKLSIARRNDLVRAFVDDNPERVIDASAITAAITLAISEPSPGATAMEPVKLATNLSAVLVEYDDIEIISLRNLLHQLKGGHLERCKDHSVGGFFWSDKAKHGMLALEGAESSINDIIHSKAFQGGVVRWTGSISRLALPGRRKFAVLKGAVNEKKIFKFGWLRWMSQINKCTND